MPKAQAMIPETRTQHATARTRPRARRPLLLFALAVVPLLVLTAQAHGDTKKVYDRFDHVAHGKATPNVECVDCHSSISAKSNWEERILVAGGRADHKPCSNNGCHGASWGRGDKTFCLNCHVGTLRHTKYPPYRSRGKSDFYLARFSHKEHIRADNCGQCHVPARKKRRRARGNTVAPKLPDMVRAGHQACGNKICHGEAVKPKMSECQSCHMLRSGKSVAPLASADDTDIFRVKGPFTHEKHNKASKQDDCRSCHNNVEVGKGAVVPLPEMVQCETCHNGKNAFPALGHKCVRCHVKPAPAPTNKK